MPGRMLVVDQAASGSDGARIRQRRLRTATICLFSFVGLISGARDSLALWIEQTVSSPEPLAVVQAVSSEVVWAVGDDGRVVITTDAGITWTPRLVPGAVNVRGLFAFDDQEATVSDQLGRFWHTTDRGVQWTPVHGPTGSSINGIHFFDDQNGWAMGDPVNGNYVILLSSDGGWSWTPSANSPPGTQFSTVRSYDWIGSQVGVFSTRDWVIWRTTSAGAEWDSVGLDFQRISGVELSNAGIGLAAGNQSNPSLRRSTDSGATWSPALHPAQATPLRNFDWIEGTNEVWAVTSQAGLFQSINGGIDWVSHTLAPSTEFVASDIDFLDQDTGWCVGSRTLSSTGRIFRWTTTTGVGLLLPIASAPLRVTAYPNPFKSHIAMEIAPATRAPAECVVYDVAGHWIWTSVAAGSNYVSWDGRDHTGRGVPSGTYFYRLKAGNNETTGRIVKLP